MNNFDSIDKAAASLMQVLKEKHKDDPRVQKKIAVMENAVQLGKAVVQLSELCSNKKKRIFQPINRMPKRKIERKMKIFRKMMDIQSARIRHELIMQTPIPKYPLGSKSLATIGDSGPEIINLSGL